MEAVLHCRQKADRWQVSNFAIPPRFPVPAPNKLQSLCVSNISTDSVSTRRSLAPLLYPLARCVRCSREEEGGTVAHHRQRGQEEEEPEGGEPAGEGPRRRLQGAPDPGHAQQDDGRRLRHGGYVQRAEEVHIYLHAYARTREQRLGREAYLQWTARVDSSVAAASPACLIACCTRHAYLLPGVCESRAPPSCGLGTEWRVCIPSRPSLYTRVSFSRSQGCVCPSVSVYVWLCLSAMQYVQRQQLPLENLPHDSVCGFVDEPRVCTLPRVFDTNSHQFCGDCGGEAAVHSIFAAPEHQPQEARGRRPHGLLCGEREQRCWQGFVAVLVGRSFLRIRAFGVNSAKYDGIISSLLDLMFCLEAIAGRYSCM